MSFNDSKMSEALIIAFQIFLCTFFLGGGGGGVMNCSVKSLNYYNFLVTWMG